MNAGQPLGAREQQILALIADGHDILSIAATLFIAEGTVKTYRRQLFAKLGAHTAAQAVHLAYQRGDLTPAGGAR